MYLTPIEEAMLEGEAGEAVARAMGLLVALGEVFEAEGLIEVESAHVSGVSYKNLGEAGLEYLEEQAELGGRIRIRATLNPAGMDLRRWREMGVPNSFAEGQLRVIEAYRRMGVEATCTCTPYLIGHRPRAGSQVAWAESSAVAYVNSVLGARTNRETGPTALASAMTGRAPLYGYRLEEGRRPTILVDVRSRLTSRLDYGALGYLIGEVAGRSVPYIRGVRSASIEQLKALSAAIATSGGIALYHIEGLTPEAREMTPHIGGLERIVVREDSLEEVVERFHGELEDPVVCLGCPHCSLRELMEAARLLERLGGERLWAFTSRGVYEKAERLGIVEAIEGAGGRVYRDTCMVVAPLREMGWREVATDSFKAAHYLSSMGFEVRVAPLRELLGGEP
ncbi:MAG: hypothetical protein AYL28_002990 [Candidatus Bathyarchaeota archaeon B23]|nr:MAG: hypothetical protein AYL28_002990 [Candidatus Bathyarchaeota archaeon B23]